MMRDALVYALRRAGATLGVGAAILGFLLVLMQHLLCWQAVFKAAVQ